MTTGADEILRALTAAPNNACVARCAYRISRGDDAASALAECVATLADDVSRLQHELTRWVELHGSPDARGAK